MKITILAESGELDMPHPCEGCIPRIKIAIVLRSTILYYAVLGFATQCNFVVHSEAQNDKKTMLGMPSFPNQCFTTTLIFFNRSKGTDLHRPPSGY